MSDCDACDLATDGHGLMLCPECLIGYEQRAAEKARAEERAAVVALIDELIADHANNYDEDATHQYATPLRTAKRLLLARQHLGADASIVEAEHG